MKPSLPKLTAKSLAVLAAITLTGCLSSDVNPSHAHSHKGYVDFYNDSAVPLCWQIDRFDARAQDFRQIFWSVEPPANAILRLPFAPGSYRFGITILNRDTIGPAEIEVQVVDGKITPVHVTFTEKGTSEIRGTTTSAGGTVYGTYGRRTKFRYNPAAMYSVSTATAESMVYRPKSEMPYAH